MRKINFGKFIKKWNSFDDAKCLKASQHSAIFLQVNSIYKYITLKWLIFSICSGRKPWINIQNLISSMKLNLDSRSNLDFRRKIPCSKVNFTAFSNSHFLFPTLLSVIVHQPDTESICMFGFWKIQSCISY